MIVNLSYEMWRQRLSEAVADADARRSARQFTKPRPPVPPAVHQIAQARAKTLAQSEGAALAQTARL
ncbi:hypothetical protein [Actinomadura macrotermitis]|uniref:Uncharacterized protein n=1 Tax=Actinomadura macrotermitis TaxID=2585200 RepID=A0A7K0C196_9ACTN|nr:hypothetical protein [Actinomadura macrotermitis]MQY07238.1 hypothetical protein [Actinomadura macrotermitis]